MVKDVGARDIHALPAGQIWRRLKRVAVKKTLGCESISTTSLVPWIVNSTARQVGKACQRANITRTESYGDIHNVYQEEILYYWESLSEGIQILSSLCLEIEMYALRLNPASMVF